MALSTPTLRRVSDAVSGTCVVVLLATAILGVLQLDTPHPEGDLIYALGFLFMADAMVFTLVGALITHRQPRNTIGWLLLAVAGSWVLGLAVSVYADYGANIEPGSLPAPVLVYALFLWTWVPAVGVMAIFVPLLFPDGHLPSPRWRWFAWLAAASMVVVAAGSLLDPEAFDGSALAARTNPLGVAIPAARTTLEVLFLLFPLCMVVSAIGAVQRYRRSSGVERLQLKWLVTAGAFFAMFFGSTLVVGMLLSWFAPDLYDTNALDYGFNLVAPIAISFFPLAVGAAILKYRLYDIDVVINRSLVFGALAVFITAVYVAVVVGIGRLVGAGDRPNLALSVAATAIVAVAFEPVRSRLQKVANRLVYGERATPYEVLSAFADRVGGAYDATELLPLMARTVAQGVDAQRSEIWLRRGETFALAATWPAVKDRPALQPPSVDAEGAVPVTDRGEVLGAIAVVPRPGKELSPVEDRLVRTLAAQAGPVLRNVRLIDDLRTSRQRLVTTQDDERRRLERNLHDGAQQSLVAVALMVRLVQGKVAAESEAAARALESASAELSRAIEELRELARGIFPVVLGERGLGAALTSLAERSTVPLLVDERLGDRLPPDIERAMYFVTAEVVAGAGRAGASEVTVSLARSQDHVRLLIEDDGLLADEPGRGLALQRLRDRAAVVDGVLEVTDGPGAGLHLLCTVPLPKVTQDVTSNAAPTSIPLGAGQ